jgi:hypothetical protein
MKTMINYLNSFTIPVNSVKKVDVDNTNSSNDEIILEPKIKNSSETTKPKKTGEFRKVLNVVFSRNTFQLLIAHHPNCEPYEDHVFKIGKLRLCRGCTLSYPQAYGLPILVLAWAKAWAFFESTAFKIHNIWWFTIAITILGVTTYFTKKYARIINDIYKVARGFLLGFFFIIIIIEPWPYKIAFGVLIAGLMIYLSTRRGKDMERTCNECEYSASFNDCPGWETLAKHFAPETTPTIDVDKIQPSDSIEQTEQIEVEEI